MPIANAQIDTITVTACPADCPEPPPCSGSCTLEPSRGCMTCLCPKASLFKHCSGFGGNKVLRLLRELAKRQTKGCQFVQGYRRHVRRLQQNKATGMDECVPFSYARCDWYLRIVMPRTRAECLQQCF
uniref:Uncharacterized protein n=1 Tax=Plectus sambesii TaxID=2011161 RepID=A0A914VA98_9BILA